MAQNYHNHVENLSGTTDAQGAMKIGAIVRPDLPPIAYTSSADHDLYKDAFERISKLPANAFRNDVERQNAAADVAQKAKEDGLTKIDHVVFNRNGDKLIAVEGNMHDPAHKLSSVNYAEAVNKPNEQTIAQANQVHAAQLVAQRTQEETRQLEDPQKIQRDPPKQSLG
jgi:hypothetical protein